MIVSYLDTILKIIKKRYSLIINLVSVYIFLISVKKALPERQGLEIFLNKRIIYSACNNSLRILRIS